MESQFEGRIYRETLSKYSYTRADDDYFVLDAEPGIMGRVRGLFPKSRFSENCGAYTHKPLIIYNSKEACRDLVWIMDRYKLSLSSEDLEYLNNCAKEYDETKDLIQDILLNSDYKKIPRSDEKGFVKIQNVESRLYQEVLIDFTMRINSNVLIADEMGLGKTVEAGVLLQQQNWRPSVIVTPVTITRQWVREMKKFFPDFKIHVTKTGKEASFPEDTDIVITNYSKLSALKNTINSFKPQSIFFDEAQELRRSGSDKYAAAAKISASTKSVGLSGTPIYNMGFEVFNVLDVLNKGCLGSATRFRDEWCDMDKVKHPDALNKYLISHGLMIRRTAKEVGIFKPDPKTMVIQMDTDLESLKKVEDIAKLLALNVLGADALRSAAAVSEFNFKLRQATGVAKAKSAAEFVANMVSNGEKVILAGWHREFWDIACEHFKKKGISYAMVTGGESIKAKDDSLLAMIEGDTQVLCLSLRSAAGLDGLQKSTRVVVFGELDWSKNAMKQLIDRVARPGQERQVLVYFLTIADGSDPVLMEKIGVKDGQFKGIVDGLKEGDAEALEESNAIGREFAEEMARRYLDSIGVAAPTKKEYGPEITEIKNLIESVSLPNSSEEEMQVALNQFLKEKLSSGWNIQREYRSSKRSRLDFYLEHASGERVIIECKNNSRKRSDAYKQVRRYSEETQVKNVFLVGPWNGVNSFEIEGVDVIVVDTTKARLMS